MRLVERLALFVAVRQYRVPVHHLVLSLLLLLQARVLPTHAASNHNGGPKSFVGNGGMSTPFQSWTFSSPNRVMQWNELPAHIRLRGRVMDVANSSDLSTIVVPPGHYNDSGAATGNGHKMIWMIGCTWGELNFSTHFDWSTILSNRNFTADNHTDLPIHDSLDPVMNQFRIELNESSAGTLSSLMILVPSGMMTNLSLVLPSVSSTVNAMHASQQWYGVSLGNASQWLDSTPADSDNTVARRHKLARAIGNALGTVVNKHTTKTGSASPTPALGVGNSRFAPSDAITIRVFLPHLGNTTEFWAELACSFWTTLYNDKRYKGLVTTDQGGGGGMSSIATTPCTVELILSAPTNDYGMASTTIEQGLTQGASLARGIYLAKDIVQAPHNVLNALSLAETAQRLAQTYRSVLSCEVLSASDCERRGMGAYLGVARGSETEAQFIHLTYHAPRGRWDRIDKRSIVTRLGLIGKGLLFDTGGYNIKTSMMELMKFDCGGAAAILGAARALAELRPPGVEVHFVVAACENMINERAMVPGDILSASNGKTIEVLNTDAEGRLTLADALVFVDRDLRCDEIVELSTLTGACMVALGPAVAGLWCANDDLANRLRRVSDNSGEYIWRMPLVEDYKEMLESKIADLKNIGGRYAGAITAALFLQNFVDRNKPYAHIDMAGPVWDVKVGQATGWGVKVVTSWVLQRSMEKALQPACSHMKED